MKKIAVMIILGSIFFGSVVFGTVGMHKKHKGIMKDGAKINCVYCHTKGKIPKAGKDFTGRRSEELCQGNGCHGN